MNLSIRSPARRLAPLLLLSALTLGGCAALNNVTSEVSSYGSWPAERRPTTFAFERLPSQQGCPSHEQTLETAARGALEQVGFRAVAEPQEADYLVQVGARVVSNDPWIYNEPLFWNRPWGGPWGGWGRWGRYGGPGPGWGGAWGGGWGGWGGAGWNGPYGPTSFERQVVLVIRERRSAQVVYETRADNTGPSPDIDYLLPAMFGAALKDFPRIDPQDRRVQTPIRQQP